MTRFATTRWSLIARAAAADEEEARLALALLCEAYWYPIYAFVRRQGYDAPDAEDLTQGYFARFLEKGFLRALDPGQRSFRAFLLVSVRNHLQNVRDHAQAQKRGGGRRLLSLDVVQAEQLYDPALACRVTPEDLYERSWARRVVERALEQLEDAASGEKRARVKRLRAFLLDDGPEGEYARIAAEWGTGESAVRAAVHRLRKEFVLVLRREVGRTVGDESEVDAEVRHLLEVLARPEGLGVSS
jgi:RNA polymerase sigma-70 factor (ECF subfamily)